MFYRRAGTRHTRYQDERQLFPLGFDRGLIIAVIVLLLAAPFLFDRLYVSGYLLPWLIWTSAALGLNLLMGWSGQIHLGYGAVMGIGAYGSVHLVRLGVPLEIAMIAGGLLSATIGTMFGGAALRMKGIYLAMATLAMQYVVDFVISHSSVISGGSLATLQVPPVRFLGIPLQGDLPTYYLAFGVCFVITLFMLNVRRTSFGRALAALREKDYAAQILGISTFRYKLLAFWVSSFIGGVVGSLLAVTYLRAISPDQFHIELSIQILAMIIVGGLGSVLGPFFGTALILFAPILLNNLLGFTAGTFGWSLPIDLRAHLPLMAYGALVIRAARPRQDLRQFPQLLARLAVPPCPAVTVPQSTTGLEETGCRSIAVRSSPARPRWPCRSPFRCRSLPRRRSSASRCRRTSPASTPSSPRNITRASATTSPWSTSAAASAATRSSLISPTTPTTCRARSRPMSVASARARC